MPDIIDLFIGPSGSGKPYQTATAAAVANAVDLTVVDEQHRFICDVFIGGLDDDHHFSGYTDDATRNIIIMPAVGAEWDGVDPLSGVYIKNSTNSVAFRPVSTVNFMEIDGICIDGSSSNAEAFGGANGGDFKSLKNLAIINAAGDGIGSSINPTLDNILIVDPGDDGVVADCIANEITVIRAGNRGLLPFGSAQFTNSFAYDSTNADFSNQGGTHSNIATSDATAAGTNPQTNRTSSDFADYAGANFTTASDSDLATEGDPFIGYALESGGGGGGVSIPVIMNSYRQRRV